MVAASKMEGGEIDYMSLPSKAERRDNRNNDDNYTHTRGNLSPSETWERDTLGYQYSLLRGVEASGWMEQEHTATQVESVMRSRIGDAARPLQVSRQKGFGVAPYGYSVRLLLHQA